MSSPSKALRLQYLIQILQTKKHYLTASILAKELDVTERTTYRDLADLDKLGFPIYHDDRGYKIGDSFKPLSLHTTRDDIELLHLLVHSSPLTKLPHVRKRCETLINKLKTNLKNQDADLETGKPIESSETITPSKLSFNLAKLEMAITKNRECILTYHSLDETKPSDRLIHPYVITIRNGNWYLIAHTPEREDYRTFRLERIQHISESGKAFQRNSNFNLQSFFNESLSVFRGDAIRIKLRLFGKAARLAGESSFPESIRFAWEPGSAAIVEGTLQGQDEIINWLLSMRDEVEILEPASLRDEYLAMVKKMARKHK